MAPDVLWERVQASFERQGMMRHLEARLLRVEPGLVEIAGGYAGLTVAADGSQNVCAVMQQTLVPVAKTY
jgi:acyl-coenzyme A thioesterase PaaI-like protein